jgi:hypothetical protein
MRVFVRPSPACFGSRSAAAEFIRYRIKQIAEVEEEIEVLQSMRIHRDDLLVLQRVFLREQAALAELRRGMKGESDE